MLQIPRGKVRLINETKQLEDGINRTVNGELIRVQDATTNGDAAQDNNSN